MTVQTASHILTGIPNGAPHLRPSQKVVAVEDHRDSLDTYGRSFDSMQLHSKESRQSLHSNTPVSCVIRSPDNTTKHGTASDACHGHRKSPMVTKNESEDLSADTSQCEAAISDDDAVFHIARPLLYTNIIFDLGDVFAFHDLKRLDMPIQPPKLKLILNSPDWYAHESGKLPRNECFKKLSSTFGISTDDLTETLKQVATTLRYSQPLINLVRKLKTAANGELNVYLLTNIAEEDWELLGPPTKSWNIFDGIYTSFGAQSRKPDHKCYHHLFKKTGMDPRTSIFVDDKTENVLAAQSLGMHGILFDDTENLVGRLKNIFGDPVQRGEQWLRSHAKDMWCRSNTGVQIRDQFTQLLMLEITGDRNLVTLDETATRTWNTFIGKPVLTTETYPDDVDTTTLAFLNLDVPSEIKHEVMDEMIQKCMTEDGLFQTYFDETRPRLDPAVSSNVLRLFYAEKRGYEVVSTLRYMHEIIRTRAYTVGARYYYHPDWFFFYLTDLVAKNNNPGLEDLRNILSTRLQERMGCPTWSDACSAALRTISAQNLGLENPKDMEILIRTQQPDGSWGKDPWVYQYGSTKVLFGSPGLITAMAVKALKAASPETLVEALKRI